MEVDIVLVVEDFQEDLEVVDLELIMQLDLLAEQEILHHNQDNREIQVVLELDNQEVVAVVVPVVLVDLQMVVQVSSYQQHSKFLEFQHNLVQVVVIGVLAVEAAPIMDLEEIHQMLILLMRAVVELDPTQQMEVLLQEQLILEVVEERMHLEEEVLKADLDLF